MVRIYGTNDIKAIALLHPSSVLWSDLLAPYLCLEVGSNRYGECTGKRYHKLKSCIEQINNLKSPSHGQEDCHP
jgi:hypothetical protein